MRFRMNKRLFLRRRFFSALFFLIFSLSASVHASVYSLSDQPSRISFSGKSTLHAFEGHAHQVRGRIQYDPKTGESALPLEIEIPSALLETENAGRDRGMHQMFESSRFDKLLWSADHLECTPLSGRGLAACKAEGRLRIRGIERPLSFLVQIQGHPDELKTESHFFISLKDFQLKPPSVLGVIRVSDLIKVDIQAVWKRESL